MIAIFGHYLNSPITTNFKSWNILYIYTKKNPCPDSKVVLGKCILRHWANTPDLYFKVVLSDPQLSKSASKDRFERKNLAGKRESARNKETAQWGDLLTSKPIWVVIVINTCCLFLYFTLLSDLPT